MAVYTRINDLQETQNMSSGDLFVVETADGTRSIKKENIMSSDDIIHSLGFTPPQMIRRV